MSEIPYERPDLGVGEHVAACLTAGSVTSEGLGALLGQLGELIETAIIDDDDIGEVLSALAFDAIAALWDRDDDLAQLLEPPS